MTDTELLRLARLYGRRALEWRRKFIGLLPEINRRKLYEARGFNSVFEFAFKYAGLSEAQVRRALNLDARFVNKPKLRKLLTNGEVSVNKLARVASIATPQNEEELAAKVKVLPKYAIEVLVRDEKKEMQNGFLQPQMGAESVPGHNLELSVEVQEKLQKLATKGLDINEILLELLSKREAEIQEEKKQLASELPQTKSRHIPARVKRLIQKEHGTICSVPSCSKPSEHLHHSNLFSLSKKHDPRYLAPLCKGHHAIAHAVNIGVHAKPPRSNH